MKILVIGANGFIGTEVVKLMEMENEVYSATRNKDARGKSVYIDLTQKDTILHTLQDIQPEVVISCAGIVENSERASQNVQFTTNLLDAIVVSGLMLKRIVISGSAAEYGVVRAEDIPVKEEAQLNAAAGYGLSKLQETAYALKMGVEHGLPVVIARVFNPIGASMHEKFLIPRILQQIQKIRDGKATQIELSRLDARRDYIDVTDVAAAISLLATRDIKQTVYNIGSGVSTSNRELVRLMLKSSELKSPPQVMESSTEPEPLVAIQADISRITEELDWKPRKSIAETIKEVIHATV